MIDIRFELNLPGRWNGRALQFGGGGYSGVVVTGTGPMPFSPDGASAATDAGLNIMRLEGGREGSTVIQRYPDDYDGVVANVPALNFSGLRLIGPRIGQDEYSEQHRRQIPTRCAVAQPLQRVQKGTRWTSMLGLAHSPQPLPRPAFVPNGYLFSQGDAYIKYFVTHDPTFDSAHFDVMRPGRHRQQVVWLSETIGAARRLGHARGCAGDAGCDRYRAGHQRAQAPLCRYPAFPR